MLSLIFPEKLIYEKPKYRTYETNEIISFLVSIDNAFSEHKKGNVSKSTDISSWVVPTGIEPVSKV